MKFWRCPNCHRGRKTEEVIVNVFCRRCAEDMIDLDKKEEVGYD